MRGISTWIWIIGGVVIGMVLLGLIFSIISNITMQQHEQTAEDEFSKIISNANALCDANEGQGAFSRIRMPDIVNSIYATREGEIQDTERTYGNYLCMNISKPICKRVDCMVEMYRLKKKETVLSLVDRLLGKRSYEEYELAFKRTRESVSILLEGMEPGEYACKFNSLINYNEKPVLILEKNTLLVLDTTPIITSLDNNFMQMLKNLGNYFGKKIAIIWEDSCVWNTTISADGSINCPDQNSVRPDESAIIRNLEDEGYSVDVIFHDRKIDINLLKNYNQVWLLRPGWCEFSLGNVTRSNQQYCADSVNWSYVELRDIKDYAKDNGLVLFTDYSPSLPKRVVNALLEYLDVNVTLIDGYEKGDYTTDIKEHEITQNISQYPIHAVGRVRCRI